MNFKRKHFVNNNIVMLTVIAITLLSLAGIGGNHFANADTSVCYDKSFQAIELTAGDTLSSIAYEYAPSDADYSDYIQEVIEINSIKDEQIHAGCYLMIPVYSKVSSK